MRRILGGAAVCVVVLALSFGTANAISHLQITGWAAGGSAVSVWAQVGPSTTLSGSYGAGRFDWRLDGVTQTSALYCLDLYHTFHFGNEWDVEPIPIPPDPPDPPPFNTGEATWVFYKYGRTDNAVQAQATQLALWEISHDQEWRTNYDENGGNWWGTGTFRYTGSLGSSTYAEADAILDDLFAHYNQVPDGSAIYYQPHPYEGNSYYYQGQIGENPEMPNVPEPGTLVLLSTGLIVLAGASWRRRTKQR